LAERLKCIFCWDVRSEKLEVRSEKLEARSEKNIADYWCAKLILKTASGGKGKFGNPVR